MITDRLHPVNMPHRRLIYVATEDHLHDMRRFSRSFRGSGIRAIPLSWEELFARPLAPRGTYALADFDRLSPSELEAAARIAAHLRAAGLTVLNDPGAFLPRDTFLRRLHLAGINDFTLWRPADGERPDRFPVFLRSIAGHRGTLTDLLHTAGEADAALAEARTAGHPISDLVFIEYAAQPQPETGVFRKFSAFRIGPAYLPSTTVGDTSWVAKHGVRGLARDEDFEREYQQMIDNPHADLARRVFDLAGLDWGRIDFGFVGGKPQIYELNTNPTLTTSRDHPNPDRRKSLTLFREGLVTGFADVTPPCPGPPIPLDGVFRLARAFQRRPRRH